MFENGLARKRKEIGTNPACIISVWLDFVTSAAHVRAGGSGSPSGESGQRAELAECHRHEHLLNVAFARANGFRLLCPYDVGVLDPETIEHAHRSHPSLVRDGRTKRSFLYDPSPAVAPFDDPLPRRPGDVRSFVIDAEEKLALVRRFVAECAEAARLGRDAAEDVILAVNELAANSLRHGGGLGTVYAWNAGHTLLCEVQDAGQIAEPLAGRVRPGSGDAGGRGLWLTNHLCDLVEMRSSPAGTTVRIHKRRNGSGG